VVNRRAVRTNAAVKGQVNKKSNDRLTEMSAVSVAYPDFVRCAKNWILGKCHTKKIVPIGNK
jgi:hypothetical protein